MAIRVAKTVVMVVAFEARDSWVAEALESVQAAFELDAATDVTLKEVAVDQAAVKTVTVFVVDNHLAVLDETVVAYVELDELMARAVMVD